LGPWAALLLLLLHHGCRWAGRGAARRADPLGVAALAALPTAAVLRRWAALAAADDDEDGARAREARGAVLDELERRDPDGFRRWLLADTPPHGDRFFHHAG
jgi:hypothetical protein